MRESVYVELALDSIFVIIEEGSRKDAKMIEDDMNNREFRVGFVI